MVLFAVQAAISASAKAVGTNKTEEQVGNGAENGGPSDASEKTGPLDESGLQELRKMSNWTKEEDDMLIQMHSDTSSTLTFQKIAEETGRHVNAVKCRWYQCIEPRWEADLDKL